MDEHKLLGGQVRQGEARATGLIAIGGGGRRTNAEADRAEAASRPEQGAELKERAGLRDARAQELEVEAAGLRCEIDEAERFEAVIRERMLKP